MRIPGKSFIWEVVPGSPGSWAEGKAARAGNVCMELPQWVLETCSTGDLWGQCGTSASGYPTRGVMELEYDLLTTVSHWLRAPPSGCQTPGIMDWCAVLVVEWASGSGKDLRENDMGKPWSQISVKTHDYGNGSNNRRLFFIKTNFYHLGNTRGKKLLLVVDLSSWNFYAQPVRNSHMFELLSLIHQSLIQSSLWVFKNFYLKISFFRQRKDKNVWSVKKCEKVGNCWKQRTRKYIGYRLRSPVHCSCYCGGFPPLSPP